MDGFERVYVPPGTFDGASIGGIEIPPLAGGPSGLAPIPPPHARIVVHVTPENVRAAVEQVPAGGPKAIELMRALGEELNRPAAERIFMLPTGARIELLAPTPDYAIDCWEGEGGAS